MQKIRIQKPEQMPAATAKLVPLRPDSAPLPPIQRNPPQAKKSKYRNFLWLILGLVLAAISYWSYTYYFTPEVTVVTATRQALVQTLVASGRVATPFRINIASQITGTVLEVPVFEGQSAKAGDLLIKLNNSEAEQSVLQAKASVDQAEARLMQMQDVSAKMAAETTKQAEAQLKEVKASFDRMAKLARQGFATNAQYQAAQMALDVAQSQVDAAKMQVATNQQGGRDFALAETQLEQSRASLKAAQARLAYTNILSPRDGVLIKRNVERGQVAQPGTVLMVLAAAGEMQLVVEIDETNLSSLHLGQTATAVADAYPGKPFEAKLIYINPAVDPERGTVEIKLLVPSPPDFLTQDMSVSTEILVQHLDDALAIESSGVNDLSTGRPWVWVMKDSRVYKQVVTPGLVGDAALQITSGITENDQIVTGQKLALKEGQRVRVLTGEH